LARNAIGDPERLAMDSAKEGSGKVLYRLLRGNLVVRDGDEMIRSSVWNSGRAIAACEDVDRHHKRRRKAVPLIAVGIPFLAGIHPIGTGGAALAAAALMIYSFWMAHDHIDSPVAAGLRFPGNPGILTEVLNALK
jgi:hypothetical protein